MIGILLGMATVIPAGTWIERTYGELGGTIYTYFQIGIAICVVLIVLKSGRFGRFLNRKGKKKIINSK